jgi:DNA-binding transcriptional regulator of glucitol operon
LLGTAGVRNSWAHPYAQIRVVVFQTRPVLRIGVGRPKLTKGNMENFNWPVDINNIPQTELDKIRPKIQAYADQAVDNALQDAHMVMHTSQ